MPSSASSGIGAGRTQTQVAIDEATTSSLRTQDEVDALCRSSRIVVPKGFTVSPAEEERYVSSPPPAGAVCVNEYALEAGLCCNDPRQHFINAVLTHFGVAPSQLAPNSWLIMAGFVGLCHSLGVEPSVAVFRRLLAICPLNHGCESYYSFRKRIQNLPVFDNLLIPLVTWKWKQSFFLVWSPVPWACPVVWGKPSWSSRAQPGFSQLTEGERSAERKLLEAIDQGPLDVNVFLNPTMTPPPPPSSCTNASSAQGTDPAADAMARAEKRTAVVQASAAPGISSLLGKKRNLDEAHAEGPLRLDLQRVSPPGFSAPDVNVADIQLGVKENARLPELLDAVRKADALREEEIKKTKAQLSEAKEALKLEREKADSLQEELKKTKENTDAMREELKNTKENADAMREELKKMKAQAKVAMKVLKKISDLR
uniref:Uncharacterized protein n=1 Tax=Avena sativa TaxID=4498 RepID=A0ACD5XJM5_AVESA